MALPQVEIGDNMLGSALLASVEVTQELNQHWECRIECRQTTDQRLKVEQYLGQPVEIKTTDDQGVTVTHFAGFVLDVELIYEVWGSYGARLTAISDSYKSDIAAHKQYYADQTLSSIGGIVGGRNGLSVSVNASSSKSLNYVQYGEPDFQFLNRIVDDYGAWLRPKKGGMEVFDSFQTGSNLQFRDADGLLNFSLRGVMAPPSFSGSHYDHHAMASNTFEQVTKPPQYYDGAQPLTGAVTSASQQLPSGFEPQRARAMTLDNYQDQLQAESERALGGAVTGTGSSRNQSLMAGNTVAIEGILDGKGTYGLIKVVHQWTPTGYMNSFVCTPWKNYRNPKPPVARMWNGVVSARVTAHNDPKKMGRIQVQFFWQGEGATHWARATAPHAGPDRGFMFMPEVGDEVAVAFEDGDPERPVILGSLWNGVQQAPRYDFRGEDIEPNNVKRLVTKSGNRLHLSDKPGQETVFLATPNHTSLSMTEHSDETGRQLVHLHSDGDIVLSAGGRVHIQSQFFSREIGSPGKADAAPAAVQPSAASANPNLMLVADKGGDGHGQLWNLAHRLGLVTTDQDRVDIARNYFRNNRTLLDGNYIDESKMSDAQVLEAFKQVNQAYRDQGGGLLGAAAIQPPGAGLTYEDNPKHGPVARGDVSARPTNGAEVLKNSVPIKGTSSARVGVDPSAGEYVMFREHQPGVFHGYSTKEFGDLNVEAQNALRRAGLVSSKGKIL